MAEAVLGELAKAVLTQIASSAIKEFKLLRDHKKELKKLEDTINTIKDVLEDADRRQAESVAVRGWLARLRVVLYDADDLFDHVSYMVLHEKANAGSSKTKEVFKRIISKPSRVVFDLNISKEVKAIRESLEDIARDMRQFNFIISLPQTVQEQPNRLRGRETHSYVRSSNVVGRNREKEDIVKLLLADNCEGRRGVSVIAVIGMGGLGKTTLGQFVYNDERVQQGFDLCMWCCVNYFSDLKVALEAIIRSATGSAAPERLGVEQLRIKLRDAIGGKRFLLVLDDVWDEDAQNWHKLHDLLDSGNGGSMVLATTRHVKVAQSMRAAKPHYRLGGLTDEGAWMLFERIAFEDGSGEHNCSELEELGRKIVKKCGNSPLAVEIIAGFLREEGEKVWFSLVNEELPRVVPVQHDKVMQVLKMSYSTLPSPVRRCFAYLSLFPKGQNLKKDKLVRMWIAQGFVGDCGARQGLEDVGEGYFSCLVNRCFIQHYDGSIYFKMHDLVHDLASEVAGPESILVDKIGPNVGDDTLRHVSLPCALADSAEQLSSFCQSKRLRAVYISGQCEMKNVDKLIPRIKAVRVWDLSFMHIGKIPDSVGQLIHLRYLDLSHNGLKILPSSICSLHQLQYLDLSNNGLKMLLSSICNLHQLQYLDLSYNDLEMLPSSIGNLYHLQSLNLSDCMSLKELPKDIGKLISLRHLQINWCGKLSEMPQGLAHLTSLVTLDSLIVHSLSGGLRYLEHLNSLSGSLTIKLPKTVWKDAATDAQKACLSKKDRLRRLRIHWEESKVLGAVDTVMIALQPHSHLESLDIYGFGGGKMPSWISDIQNLVSLSLDHCGGCVKLPSLRCLQSLKVLKISKMSSMVVIEEDGIGSMPDYPNSIFFPSLETLSFYGMPNLTGWWKHAPSIQLAFRSVTKVTIWDCPKLTTCMPLFPQVEVLELLDIQEKLFWQAIGSDGTNKLKTLTLGRILGLRNLPGAQIRHLSALRVMNLGSFACSPIARHVQGVEYLTSLQELAIIRSKEVYMSWEVILGLPHLRILEFSSLEKLIDVGSTEVQRQPNSSLQKFIIKYTSGKWLESIPWRSFPSLHSLELWDIRDLEALPQGIQHLAALQELQLLFCKSLISLSHWMINLSSLRTLWINNCSKELKERCERLTGEDWPNIQHIPDVQIYFTNINWPGNEMLCDQ